MRRRGARGLALAALAVALGGVAAGEVAGREAALERAIGPTVGVVVARGDIAPGDALGPGVLAVRRVPARYAPRAGFASMRLLAGARARVAIPAGADVAPGAIDDGSTGALAPGRRIADVVALGSPDHVVAGARVDVLVTRERADGRGETRLSLEDVEVLAARPVDGDGAPRVAAQLLVGLRDAVYLTAAQSFARELRLLPRAPGDRRRGARGTTVGSTLP